MLHLCINFVEKKIIHLNHQLHKRDSCYHFFKQANNAMAMLPPPPAEDLGIVWFDHLT
jgi:hypothetical protein